jgi:DNA-directed RNA polymerase alpha subunit
MMINSKKSLRTCSNGHQYYKSSGCPTCPKCEQERIPEGEFLSQLSVPARRALENNGITTIHQLSNFSEKEILQFHGMGPASLPKLRVALQLGGLTFKSRN